MGWSETWVRTLAGAMLAALAFVAPAGAGAPSDAGRIELVEGSVTLVDAASRPRVAVVGGRVREGDTIATGADGEIHLQMEDGGFLAMRPNSRLTLTAYRAQGDDDDRSILNLLRGSLRSITGWIARQNPQAYRVRTPSATIGVRGTDHEPLVIPEGSAEGEPGTYDKVNAGGSFIEGRHGRVDIAPRQVGFASLRKGDAPRRLAEIPAFFRRTRHEAKLDRLHEQLRPQLERKREDRRKQVIERKARQDARAGGKRDTGKDSDRGRAGANSRKPDPQAEFGEPARHRAGERQTPKMRPKQAEERRERHPGRDPGRPSRN